MSVYIELYQIIILTFPRTFVLNKNYIIYFFFTFQTIFLILGNYILYRLKMKQIDPVNERPYTLTQQNCQIQYSYLDKHFNEILLLRQFVAGIGTTPFSHSSPGSTTCTVLTNIAHVHRPSQIYLLESINNKTFSHCQKRLTRKLCRFVRCASRFTYTLSTY